MSYTDHFSTDELRLKLALYRRVLEETDNRDRKSAILDGISVVERALAKRNPWDRQFTTAECLYCDASGVAPGDGVTECGFCVKGEQS